ncbi:MAG: putative secreted FAD-binding protein [Conexibacter sp.]|nr:putative secreted FAD-binding protein [Conexibacter sp.]
MSDLHVLIAGGGVGGLCLAQGLTRAGVTCAVYERDPGDTRRAGYRLTMNADGGEGLRACLPDDLYDLYLETSRKTPARARAVVVDQDCRELSAAPHLGPPNDGPRPHTAIDRRVLRQILLGRLGDAVHAGAAATRFEDRGDGVRLHLADGTTADGDVLVAADGVGSAIRRQLLPDVEIIPADVGGLGLFARSPLTPAVLAELPEILLDGFVIARDDAGGLLALGVYDPRRPVAQAAAALAPDVPVEGVDPYMMISGGVLPGTTIPQPGDWTADTPRAVHDGMLQVVAGWHPALRGLVERIDLETLFWFPFRRLDPAPPWPTTRVTLLGDAIHAMMPTRGQGANMALRDAGILAGRIAAAARGEQDLLEAIAAYEAAMRDYVYPIMDLSEDHGRFGGGGLRPAGRA